MTGIKDSKTIKSGNRNYYVPNRAQTVIYNGLKIEMQKKFSLSIKSRDEIIKSLISYLTQGDYLNYSIQKLNLSIIRTDIKKFFPSVNKHILYQKLNNSNILSNNSINILKEFMFTNKIEGIPLGLQFSNHLAEFYLEDFDKDIKLMFQPVMYYRYVDDIVIINYDDTKDKKERAKFENENKELLSTIFSKYGLQVNQAKTKISYLNHNNLKTDLDYDYLGYKFFTKDGKLCISMSDDKYRKILNKVKREFYKFKKNKGSKKAFWILYYKLINTLYGITSFNNEGKKFKFGIGYNYRYINDTYVLDKLIKEVKKLIFSCKLDSHKTSTLLNIINYDHSSLEILRKRFNYLKLTSNQKKLIKKRLNANNISLGQDFSKKLFYLIYN
ncbi:RNA-directed DNA polymerase [Lysinibacillus sphaericus]|uniref:RNA-directed DNA polymerase n=1 Tax=Lysinibacillus sphaericus TaxID=1421 RepID=A0A544UGE9_LYSSH|nr:RNA-directed DNA polymerase [Lysinibacillus sp. SDF0037]TQR31726.1 RNA-directed DNA polymerase [Lysinibacillus sp. SDF0037]